MPGVPPVQEKRCEESQHRRELAFERQRVGPDDPVVGGRHELPAHLVEGELLERELGQPGVLVVADAVLEALDDRMAPSGWSVRITWKA
jgi:hypothetical protein